MMKEMTSQKIVKDKLCALTKKHEATEMILNEQRIQLDDKEKELKNTFSSFNLQLENKINEIKEVKSEVFNLRRQIEANERGLPDQENQIRGREPIESNIIYWIGRRTYKKDK